MTGMTEGSKGRGTARSCWLDTTITGTGQKGADGNKTETVSSKVQKLATVC